MGSFVSQDPLGLTAGDNVYDYSPNVWGWIDPLGLCCKANKDPDYIYRTISPEDPHYELFKKIGDTGYIEPKGGHNDLYLHVQQGDTDSIFTSWSYNKEENWRLWSDKKYIQLKIDTRNMPNEALDVSKWSWYPEEYEVTVLGRINNVVRVR